MSSCVIFSCLMTKNKQNRNDQNFIDFRISLLHAITLTKKTSNMLIKHFVLCKIPAHNNKNHTNILEVIWKQERFNVNQKQKIIKTLLILEFFYCMQ